MLSKKNVNEFRKQKKLKPRENLFCIDHAIIYRYIRSYIRLGSLPLPLKLLIVEVKHL